MNGSVCSKAWNRKRKKNSTGSIWNLKGYLKNPKIRQVNSVTFLGEEIQPPHTMKCQWKSPCLTRRYIKFKVLLKFLLIFILFLKTGKEWVWFDQLFQVNGSALQPWQQRADFLLLGSHMGVAKAVRCWNHDQHQEKRCGFRALW